MMKWQKYYEANPETFKNEESVTAKHILVDSFEQATICSSKHKRWNDF